MIQQKEAALTVVLFICFGAFFLSCPVVLWEGGLFAAMSNNQALQWEVLDGFGAFAIVFGIGWGLWCLSRGTVDLPRVGGVLGALLYAGASCAYAAVQALGLALPSSVFVVLGAFLGVGFVLTASAWCTVLARYDLRGSLVGLGVACGLASLIGLGFSLGLLPAALLAYCFCVLFGVAAPCVYVLRQHASCTPEVLENVEVSHFWESFRTMILNPCLGLFLFVFVMSARGFVFAEHRYIGAVSVIAAAVIVVVLARAWPKFSLSTIYRVFLPAAAALFIVLSSFPTTSLSFSGGFIVSHGAMAVIALLALASLCAVSHAGEFSPSVVGAALAVVVGAAVFIGVNLQGLMLDNDELGGALLVCAMIYFVYVLLSPLVDYHRLLKECEASDGLVGARVSGELDGGVSGEGVQAFDRERACAMLADEKNLSAREREILPYLARGHRPSYVANVLCISEHTVRTHVRNMYRKLGVNSREELILLIESV